MRKKTDKEKEVLGSVEWLLRNLNIKNETLGYGPLMDIIAYAYAFPEEDLGDIVKLMEKENYYVGIFPERSRSKTDVVSEPKENAEYVIPRFSEQEKNDAEMYPTLVHAIKTAIEGANQEYLQELELDKLNTILKGKLDEREEELLSEIGAKYEQYSNDERIVFYFIKKILKRIDKDKSKGIR